MALDLDTDWSGFLAFCERTGNWHNESHGSAVTNGRAFRDKATRTYEEAMNLARYGWEEGRNRISSLLAATAPAFARASSTYLDVAGSYPIAAMAAAGDMQCMVNRDERTMPRPVIRLAIPVNFLANVLASNVMNRGVAICRVIDALEGSGTRVELIAGWRNVATSGPTVFGASVTVKRPDDPLELDRVAFAFAHPSMNRRLGFRLRELTKPQRGWETLGRSCELTDEDFPNAIRLRVISPVNQDSFSTSTRAFEAIAAEMRAAGVEIETGDNP